MTDEGLSGSDDPGGERGPAQEAVAPSGGSRLARTRGLLGVAGRRVGHRLRRRDGQTLLSVGGVAVAVALLLVVTSVSAGLITESTVAAGGADYWVVPEGSSGSAVTAVEGQRLGQVHRVTDELLARQGVTGVSPVLTAAVRMQVSGGAGGDSEDGESDRYVLVIGVVPDGEGPTVAGLSAAPLTSGDPYYANGSYDGRWTGEAVLSASGAESLAAGDATLGSGDALRPASGEAGGTDRQFTVTAVAETSGPGVGQLPVAVVHLSELQRLTGGTEGDVADQLLVATDGSVSRERLTGVYPNVDVLTRTELLVSRAGSSGLPLAMAVAGLAVAGIVGTLFLVTTVGFSVVGDAKARAIMAAVGVSGWSRSLLVGLETLAVAVVGGLAGVALWAVGTGVVLIAELLGESVPFAARPVFGAYGLVVAVGIGLVALPPLVIVSRRSRAVREVLR